MLRVFAFHWHALAIALAFTNFSATAAERSSLAPKIVPRRVAVAPARYKEPLVDLAIACPGVVIELRYATTRNITGRLIYPAGARALLRESVAARLNQAQRTVAAKGFLLKVWDAYRPSWAQRVLWDRVRDRAFVVEPSATGSMHSWGAAVDVTLADNLGRDVPMPTDFDAFTAAARYDYRGSNPEIAANLKLLKRAMSDAGFRHIQDEWWHYSAADAIELGPVDASLEPRSSDVREAAEEPSETAPKPAAAKRARRSLFPPRPGDNL
ncbi:MAG: D-alanyl-D-alanine dipeptidase [Chthoniobacter sp.]|jgi:D-alanyl-D-alanine dipeptidase|nr:D-alanyl-D-alanine dipeptidase [Chthoniobacter sp.]